MAPSVVAHPVASERLELVNQRIAADPTQAALYLERGQIYHHEDAWDAALADYQRAAELGLDPNVSDLAHGELLQQAGRPAEAKVFLDRLLNQHPDHLQALEARARAYSALGLTAAAADDYHRLLTLAPKPAPDLYLEAIRAAVRADRNADALRWADMGLDRLGPLSVLATEAIELEVTRRRYDHAIARLDRIVATSSFVEKWLVRRAEVLALAGRQEDACAAYKTALEALERRPAKRRTTRALTELERRIRNGLRPSEGTSRCD